MSFNETIPLLAAADWWEIAVGLVFFVLYGIGQLLGSREEAQKKKARPLRPKPQPPQPGAPAGPPNQADPLRAEVEEFLRRAQGKPAQPKPERPQRQRAAQQQPLELRPIERPQREAASRPPRPAKPLARMQPKLQPPKPQPLQPVNLRSESVVDHVAHHVNTRDIKEHISHLGEEVALADEHLEAHLQEAFSGQLGSLQHREREVAEQGPSIAEEIRNLISQPTGMRQMIVANEILRRPEDRW